MVNKLGTVTHRFIALILFVSCTNAHVQPQTEERNSFVPTHIEAANPSHAPLAQYTAEGSAGMVVTEGVPVSQIGLEVLEKGGNAIDAAIAVSFAVSAYRPQSTGLGGGGFFLVYLKKENKIVFLDARERAPAATSLDLYFKDGKYNSDPTRFGGPAVATPGLVAGLDELFQKYSSQKIAWKHLLEPARRLAADGFPVYRHLASTINQVNSALNLSRFPDTKILLSNPKGQLLAAGDLFQNPRLARTLEVLADNGAKAFYQGRIAREIVDSVRSNGGVLALADLRNYKPIYRDVVSAPYKDYTIFSAPLPSSGGVMVLQMLKLLENFDFSTLSPAEQVTLSAKIMRLSFRDRQSYLGDTHFSQDSAVNLVSQSHIQKLLTELNNGSESPSSAELSTPGNTTHFCIVDSEGNIVSSTQSINHYFGSALLAGNTGVFLNNTMNDFAFSATSRNVFGLLGGDTANMAAPNKTPLSSMSPTIVFKNGNFFMALGSPGGPRIISAVFNTLVSVLTRNTSLTDAVFAPRLHQQWQPAAVELERDGYSGAAKAALTEAGFPIVETEGGLGNVSAILFDARINKYIGVADPRREGVPLGFAPDTHPMQLTK